jgi:hypothetical protein
MIIGSIYNKQGLDVFGLDYKNSLREDLCQNRLWGHKGGSLKALGAFFDRFEFKIGGLKAQRP